MSIDAFHKADGEQSMVGEKVARKEVFDFWNKFLCRLPASSATKRWISLVICHVCPPPRLPGNFLKLWIELFNSFHVPVSSRLPRHTTHQSSYWNSSPAETVWCRTDSNLTAVAATTIQSVWNDQLFRKPGHPTIALLVSLSLNRFQVFF